MPTHEQPIAAALQTLRYRHPLRVAVVAVAPWVVQAGGTLCGAEIDALRRYCRWRGREARLLDVQRTALVPLLAAGTVDLAIGGLLDSESLAAHAHLVAFSSHRLRHGEPRHGPARRHVWAIARHDLFEMLALRTFLLALRTMRRAPAASDS